LSNGVISIDLKLPLTRVLLLRYVVQRRIYRNCDLLNLQFNVPLTRCPWAIAGSLLCVQKWLF